MPLVIVEEADGRIALSSPYHPKFPVGARSLGGIWNAARRVWLFDAADADRVRSLCRQIYGTDGIRKPPVPGMAGTASPKRRPMCRITTATAAGCASG